MINCVFCIKLKILLVKYRCRCVTTRVYFSFVNCDLKLNFIVVFPLLCEFKYFNKQLVKITVLKEKALNLYPTRRSTAQKCPNVPQCMQSSLHDARPHRTHTTATPRRVGTFYCPENRLAEQNTTSQSSA